MIMKDFQKVFSLFFLLPNFLCADFVIADLVGQLGNQMFIVAAAESLAIDNDAEAIFPSFKEKENWNLRQNGEEIFFRVQQDRPTDGVEYVYREPHYHYKEISYKKNMELLGYFQSDKYFRHNKERIIDLFAPSEKIKQYLAENYQEILSNPKSVSIHYRDYTKDDPTRKHHPNTSLGYFKRAVALFPKDSIFIVFSNKISWCKKHFPKLKRNFVFIENEHFYHDFYLMSMCKHNIISNSSFSWWAAYLNRNPNKRVVAPKGWFSRKYISNWNDVYPPEWILVDS